MCTKKFHHMHINLKSNADGAKKGLQLKEMATDLSKFLQFGEQLDIKLVSSFKCIERYTEELVRRQIGPSGIIGKLTAFGMMMSFVLHSELYILAVVFQIDGIPTYPFYFFMVTCSYTDIQLWCPKTI